MFEPLKGNFLKTVMYRKLLFFFLGNTKTCPESTSFLWAVVFFNSNISVAVLDSDMSVLLIYRGLSAVCSGTNDLKF